MWLCVKVKTQLRVERVRWIAGPTPHRGQRRTAARLRLSTHDAASPLARDDTTAIEMPSVAYALRGFKAASMSNLQQRMTAIRQRLEPLERAHPTAFLAAAIAAFTLVLVILGGSTWVVYDVFHGLPSASELRDVGSMAQAT